MTVFFLFRSVLGEELKVIKLSSGVNRRRKLLKPKVDTQCTALYVFQGAKQSLQMTFSVRRTVSSLAPHSSYGMSEKEIEGEGQ